MEVKQVVIEFEEFEALRVAEKKLSFFIKNHSDVLKEIIDHRQVYGDDHSLAISNMVIDELLKRSDGIKKRKRKDMMSDDEFGQYIDVHWKELRRLRENERKLKFFKENLLNSVSKFFEWFCSDVLKEQVDGVVEDLEENFKKEEEERANKRSSNNN